MSLQKEKTMILWLNYLGFLLFANIIHVCIIVHNLFNIAII